MTCGIACPYLAITFNTFTGTIETIKKWGIFRTPNFGVLKIPHFSSHRHSKVSLVSNDEGQSAAGGGGGKHLLWGGGGGG